MAYLLLTLMATCSQYQPVVVPNLQEDYQQMAFTRPAPSGGLDYAGIPTSTLPPAENGGPTHMSGRPESSLMPDTPTEESASLLRVIAEGHPSC
jgi:hypothetical protein